ncbi:MAG TPA: alpha-glucan family phosphorylase [Thermomicrobiales bacterium]|jgi:starch phosphorylase|nr:alpha-glucan family phosphorylase [Thermomicrobiales bacterium]
MTLSYAEAELPKPIEVPARIDRLNALAYNLWWSWNQPAHDLFQRLSPPVWHASGRNPIRFLRRLDPAVLTAAAADNDFLSAYDAAIEDFDAAIYGKDTWIAKHAPQLTTKTLAYFSAEFGLHPTLPIYSGGLGVLSGDHMKEASDIGLPTVAVSLLYRQGYLRQRLDASGWQQDVTAPFGPADEPTTLVRRSDGTPLEVEIDFASGGGSLRVQVWRVLVGRVHLYLLDSDLEGNPEWTRTISSRLYGGDREHRLRQEIILGIAGVRVLRALGLQPDYWHANEGHAALHMVERAREFVAEGKSFEAAADIVRNSTVFTSHTPVPAGHDIFSREYIDRYFHGYWPQLGLDREEFWALGQHGHEDGFNFTALSMRLSGHRNGVSVKHGEVTREMWHDIWPGLPVEQTPISSITNGVHLSTWLSPRTEDLLDRHLHANWRKRTEEALTWEPVSDIPHDEFWQTHLQSKQDLIDLLDRRMRARWLGGNFEPNQVVASAPFLERDALTIGFARRFATYKRATLIFRDPDRLARILTDLERPVQIIFAGKAHPADDGGKRLIQEIFHHAQNPKFGGRLAFAEDYDMRLTTRLVAGVDIWLNNPIFPLEASGTSGMKAAANGVPNVSILDGWWIEGYQDEPRNGWGIDPATSSDEQDAIEAEAIYRTLEEQVVPLYYQRGADGIPHGWVDVCLSAMRTVSPQFSMRRMLRDYVRELYLPASAHRVTDPVEMPLTAAVGD